MTKLDVYQQKTMPDQKQHTWINLLLIGFDPAEKNEITHRLSSDIQLQTTVNTLESLAECKDFLVYHKVNLILLDIASVQDESLTQLRESKNGIPILLCTEAAREAEAALMVGEAVDEYVLKEDIQTHAFGLVIKHAAEHYRHKKSNRTLKQARDKSRRLNTRIRHAIDRELRLGMASILGQAKCLSIELFGDRRLSAQSIERQGHQVLFDVHHLLMYWKLELEPIELKAQVLDIGKILAQVCEEASKYMDANTFTITYQANKAALKVYTDRVLLKTALALILRFVVKYATSDHIEIGGGQTHNATSIYIIFSQKNTDRKNQSMVLADIDFSGLATQEWYDHTILDRELQELAIAKKIIDRLNGQLTLKTSPDDLCSIKIALPYL